MENFESILNKSNINSLLKTTQHNQIEWKIRQQRELLSPTINTEQKQKIESSNIKKTFMNNIG